MASSGHIIQHFEELGNKGAGELIPLDRRLEKIRPAVYNIRMRKFLLTITLIALVGTGLPAQERERRFTLQTSPLLLAIDTIALGVADSDTASFFIMDMEGQYKINDIFNVSLTASFFIIGDDEDKASQFAIKPMFVYRPLGTGLNGFYAGLYSSIGLQSDNTWGENDSWIDIGLGINSGYKWIFNNGFTLQLGAGLGKTWTQSDSESYSRPNSDGRITLPNLDIMILDFKLGYSF